MPIFENIFGTDKPTIIKQLEKRFGRKFDHYKIDNNKQVTSLDLFAITELPLEVCQLQNLLWLQVTGQTWPGEYDSDYTSEKLKALTHLPAQIGQLQNLQYLSLWENKIITLPAEIGQLQNLQKLAVINDTLFYLPKEIGQLQNLQELSLHNNELTHLPKEIGQLKNLQELELKNNQLTYLPKEIGQLRQLKKLSVENNLLVELPKEIGQLQQLQLLDILYGIYNIYYDIPKWHRNNYPKKSKLSELKEIGLKESKLTRLPKEIGNLSDSCDLYISGNPLVEPPLEIAEKGISAIRAYFKALEEEQARKPRPLNELKLLLVGDGGAGKTSLLKRLLGQTFDPNETQTHGINLNTLEMEIPNNPQFSGGPVKLHCWDFGGQEMMHATHQFFLSKRSLYVLVIDSRREAKTDYWLKHIHSFGENSPVIIVINKMDENPSFDLPRKQWQDKYPNIQQFCRLSCRTGEGLDTLKQTIQQTIPHVELVQTVFPANWWQVKTDLEQLTEQNKDYLSYDHYLELCQTHDIVEESAQQTLITFLHDLGIIIHFDQKLLRETNVINPRWLTEAVYKLLTAPQVIQQQGVLFTNQLTKLLDARIYPSHKHDYLLELLKKFELGYALTADKFLFPDLFPVQEPTFIFEESHALHFVLEYDFLPKSIISRFIVKMHSDIKENLYWRTGVVIYEPTFDTTAVIRAIDHAKRIHIYVTGQHPREYLAIILFIFRDIHHSFAKLTVKEKIGLPDNPDVMVSYTHLLSLEKQGKATYTPEDSNVSYDVKTLLGTIHNPHATEAEMLAILRKIESVVGEKSEEGILEQVNDVFKINPEFFGIGVDVNELVKKIGGWVEKLRKTQ